MFTASIEETKDNRRHTDYCVYVYNKRVYTASVNTLEVQLHPLVTNTFQHTKNGSRRL